MLDWENKLEKIKENQKSCRTIRITSDDVTESNAVEKSKTKRDEMWGLTLYKPGIVIHLEKCYTPGNYIFGGRSYKTAVTLTPFGIEKPLKVHAGGMSE